MNIYSSVTYGLALLCSLLAVPAMAQRDDPVDRIVVFGDSLSDGGFFKDLLNLPDGQGKFTTPGDLVAPEVFAGNIGLELLSLYGSNGTNSAIGGARVTAANGPSLSITTQIDNFLNAGGSFGKNDLVYIQGGGNDFFAFQAGGSVDNTILTTAANDLATQVQRLQNAGAQQLLLLNVQSAGQAGLILFNETYEAALAANGTNALFFDMDSLFNEIIANPSEFGIVSFAPACAGSSLTCTESDLVSPDAPETFLLADDVHPSAITQRIQGQAIASLLKAPEQIGQLTYSAQAIMNDQRGMYREALLSAYSQEVGTTLVFGKVGVHDFDNSGSTQRIGIDQSGTATNIGLDYRLNATANVGISLAVTEGDGDFRNADGGYDFDAFSAAFYVSASKDKWRLRSDLQWGQIDYDDIERVIVLGPSTRFHEGDTEADFLGLSAGAAYTVFQNDIITLEPDVSFTYQFVDVDGYSESLTQSTEVDFGDQDIESLTGSFGLLLRNTSEDYVSCYLRLAYETELKNDDRRITVTPFGAPISYTTEIFEADDSFYTFEGGISIKAFGDARARIGFNGVSGREDLDGFSAFAGLTIPL